MTEELSLLLSENASSFAKRNFDMHTKFLLCFLLGDMQFPEMNVKITPNTPQLVDVFPSSFKVCGHVAPHKLISGTAEGGPSSVVLSKEGSTSEPVTIEAEQETGKFCVFLEPGKYEGRVKVTDLEKSMGLQ
jgi:hypothetical protein